MKNKIRIRQYLENIKLVGDTLNKFPEYREWKRKRRLISQITDFQTGKMRLVNGRRTPKYDAVKELSLDDVRGIRADEIHIDESKIVI